MKKRYIPLLATLIAVAPTLTIRGNQAFPSSTIPAESSSGYVASDSVADGDTQQAGAHVAVNAGDEMVSFLTGVIPPPPQAAAITRYAGYPVSHTTGLPDISVPLYEIDLGGYRLPISISYHASGMRPDEIPGYVGSGWTLNAGGAVTRTILGMPDKPMTDTDIQLPVMTISSLEI